MKTLFSSLTCTFLSPFVGLSFFAHSLVALSFLASSTVHAADASSTSSSAGGNLKTELSEIAPNRKFTDEHEITDIKIRADAGSLSKYSFRFNLSFFGPTFGDISAKEQPNPDGSAGPYSTALSGTIGMRYRTSSQTSLSLGTGLKAIHPLQGADRFDVSTPYLSYDMTKRTESGIQMRNSFGVSYVTLPEYTKLGEVAGANYDFSSIYNIGASGYAVGVDTSLSYFYYTRKYQPSDKSASRGGVQIFPTAKYNFTDKLNVTTSTALSWTSPRDRANESILLNRSISQRLGVGYAISRDIYVFPYVTIYPSHMAWDMTTMNISTSFSVL